MKIADCPCLCLPSQPLSPASRSDITQLYTLNTPAMPVPGPEPGSSSRHADPDDPRSGMGGLLAAGRFGVCPADPAWAFIPDYSG